MITRKVKHMLVSQLEIVALAFGVLAICIYIVYFLGRLSLIALAAAALRRMPAGVYVSTWAQTLPNVQ
jgi:hypothetical protein